MLMFMVRIECSNIEILLENEYIPVGFFKNYYVISCSKEAARYIALRKATREIYEKRESGALRFETPNLRSSRAEVSLNFFRLFFGEGFVFYIE
jgi:hypothetical protein